MSKKIESILNDSEIILSDASVSGNIYNWCKRGLLRKLGGRLYTSDVDSKPEDVVNRNFWDIVAMVFPGGVIADRTALDGKPAKDGTVFVVSNKTRTLKVPGLVVRSRSGHPAITNLPDNNDKPFMNKGLYISSTPRSILENMRKSRNRNVISRTYSQSDIEKYLDSFLRMRGTGEFNTLRDNARILSVHMGLDDEFNKLNSIMGAMLQTRETNLVSNVARARSQGKSYDPDRIDIFNKLADELRPKIYEHRKWKSISNHPDSYRTLSFFEAYFSNFIEGTKFSVEEATGIIIEKIIPEQRPEDAHDVLGTWNVVSNQKEMSRCPDSFDSFIEILKDRHLKVMELRTDMRPGQFKVSNNAAGGMPFVSPELVLGTLEKGFDILCSLPDPFARAAFMMFLVAEVHPFVDGNGRIARIMMNAELKSAGLTKIVIPTAFRGEYLAPLRNLSQSAPNAGLDHMLDHIQKWTHAVEWKDINATRKVLSDCNAFVEETNVISLTSGNGQNSDRLKFPNEVENGQTMDIPSDKNLSGQDLSGKNFKEADLEDADLSRANLSESNLSGANLKGANLESAKLLRTNLSGANLRIANLSEANLSGANLKNAELKEAVLKNSNLENANLSGADLRSADLSGVNLENADLTDADLWNANLFGADLRDAVLYQANLIKTNFNDANLTNADTRLTILDSDIKP